MISRVSSHYLFCSPEKILRQHGIERDENAVVTAIFSLNEGRVETSQTVFFDGLISLPVISLKNHLKREEMISIAGQYNYVDLSDPGLQSVQLNDKPLIVDFGTENEAEINHLLRKTGAKLSEIPLFTFVAACVYYPALLSDQTAVPELHVKTGLLLWEKPDLQNKVLKADTAIRKL